MFDKPIRRSVDNNRFVNGGGGRGKDPLSRVSELYEFIGYLSGNDGDRLPPPPRCGIRFRFKRLAMFVGRLKPCWISTRDGNYTEPSRAV